MRLSQPTSKADHSKSTRVGPIGGLIIFFIAIAALSVLPTASAQANITGEVVTDLGTPVVGETIQLKKQMGNSYVDHAETTTGPDGMYSFQAQEEGNYLVTFSRNGVPYSERVNLREGDETSNFEVGYVLNGGSVGGVVTTGTEESAEPVEGINVTIYEGDEAVASGTTGPYGSFLIQGLNESSMLTLELIYDGVPYERTVYTDDDPVTFDRQDFEFTQTVSGTIDVLEDREKSPADGVELALIHGSDTVETTTTDAGGNYSFEGTLDSEAYVVETLNEPYRMDAVAGSNDDISFTMYRSSPLVLKEKQVYISTGEEEGTYTVQEFIMVDQESIIASSELKSFDNGVAVVDMTFEQNMPPGTSRAFIAPVMGQGVGETTVMNATVANQTASLDITNFEIDLSDNEQTIGATYEVVTKPEGNLEKSLEFSKSVNYRTENTMVVNRISPGSGMYDVKLSVDSDNVTKQFGNYHIRGLDRGDTITGTVTWKTYSQNQVKTILGGIAAVIVVGVGLVVATRRRNT